MSKQNLLRGEDVVKEISVGNSFEVEDSVTSNCSDSNSYSEDHNSLSSGEGDDDELSTCEQGMKKKNDFGCIDGSNHRNENCSVDDTASLTNDPSLVSSFSSDTRECHSPCRGRRRKSHGSSSEELQLNQEQHDEEDFDNNPQHDTEKYGAAFVGSHSPCSAAPQLRHRRCDSQYTQAVCQTGFHSVIDENENLDGYYCSDCEEDGLSPSAKHKSISVTTSGKENISGVFHHRRLELILFLVIQFTVMTCVVYYILTATQSYTTTWRMPSLRSARRLIRRIESRALQQQKQIYFEDSPNKSDSSASRNNVNGFIIRLHGGRLDLLRRSIDQHAHCRVVSELQIDWHPEDGSSSILDGGSERSSVIGIVNADNDFPSELLQHPSGKVVRVDPNVANSKQQGSSDAIFLLKEGITFTCGDLERAYSEWIIDPVRVVGFFPDTFASSPQYSLVSDEAMFVHRLYLSTRPVTQLLKLSPTVPRECHHLALSAYISSISMHSPLVIASSSAGYEHQFSSRRGQFRRRNSYASGRPKATTDCIPVLLQAAGISSIPTIRTQVIGQSRQLV